VDQVDIEIKGIPVDNYLTLKLKSVFDKKHFNLKYIFGKSVNFFTVDGFTLTVFRPKLSNVPFLELKITVQVVFCIYL